MRKYKLDMKSVGAAVSEACCPPFEVVAEDRRNVGDGVAVLVLIRTNEGEEEVEDEERVDAAIDVKYRLLGVRAEEEADLRVWYGSKL